MKNTMKKMGLLFVVSIMSLMFTVSVSAFKDSDYWTEHGLLPEQVVLRFNLNGVQVKGVEVYDTETKRFTYHASYGGDVYDMVPNNNYTEVTQTPGTSVVLPYTDINMVIDGYGVRFSGWECSYVINNGNTLEIENLTHNIYVSGTTFFIPYLPEGSIICFDAQFEIIDSNLKTWGDYEYDVLEDGTVEIATYYGSATTLDIPSEIDGRVVTSIGNFAFSEKCCKNLKNINIPSSVTHVGRYAFHGTAAEEYAKNNRTNGLVIIDDCLIGAEIDYVLIPESIRLIEDSAFGADIPVFKFFEVDSKNKYFTSDEYGVLYNKDKTELICYPNASKNAEYRIPETVNTIREFCSFYLEVLVLPANIKNMPKIAFCASIKDVYMYNNKFDMDTVFFAEINQERWFEIRDEFSERCEEYVARVVNGTLTDEVIDEFTVYVDMISHYIEADSAVYGTIHCYPGSTAETFAKSKGITYKYIVDDVEIEDNTTGLVAVFAPETFNTEVEMTIEEGGKNADTAFENIFGKYKSYDITFKSNGVEVQPNGKVTVKIPISSIFDVLHSKVYHIDENGNATLIESYYEDGYIIFEAEHFSEYVIVDESSKIETPTEPDIPDDPTPDEPEIPDEPTEPDEPIEPDTPSESCTCKCHGNFIQRLIFKITNFFAKLFNPAKKICACGVKH